MGTIITRMALKMISSRLIRLLGSVFACVQIIGCAVQPGLNIDNSEALNGAPSSIGGYDLIDVSFRNISEFTDSQSLVSGFSRLYSASDLIEEVQGTDYLVGSGDVLSIIVWDHPELTNPAGEFRDPQTYGRLVNSQGTIFYPYVGELKVSGLTVSSIRRLIASRLAKYVRDPQVDVRIAAFRSQTVRVTGAVEAPLAIPLNDRPLTISDAIAEAGGLAENANRAYAVLFRNGRGYSVRLSTSRDAVFGEEGTRLIDQDTLFIPTYDEQSIYVFGGVSKQSKLVMPEGSMSLAEALSAVEGLDEGSADQRRIYVLRQVEDEREGSLRTKVYRIGLSDLGSMLLTENFALAPRDIVYVDKTGLASVNLVISQFLPSVSTLFQLERLLDSD